MTDIRNEVTKLKALIVSSERVLITSHVSPDPDSISSVVLLGTTLTTNYPNKQIVTSLEELTGDLEYLDGYKDIKNQKLLKAVLELQPELIVMVDAMNVERCSRSDSVAVREWIVQTGAKLAIIDHHEPDDTESGAVYINQGSPAAVQDVYEVCFDHLRLQKPAGYALTAITGLYSDSGGFVYENPRHQETFKLVNELLDSGLNMEEAVNRLRHYSQLYIASLGELAANLKTGQDYAYSAITDDFIERRVLNDTDFDDLRSAIGMFVNEYIRNINGLKWGFVVYRDIRGTSSTYSVSLRSQSGIKDVSAIAKKLNGGGHKPAAGAKFEAQTINDAIKKVQAVILEP